MGYTAFVPSEEAFAKLSKATLDHLLDPKNVKELQEIIQTHIQSNAVLRAGCKKIGRPYNDIFSGTISDLEANQGINELEVSQGMLLSTRPGWYHSAPVHMMGLVDSITLLPMVS